MSAELPSPPGLWALADRASRGLAAVQEGLAGLDHAALVELDEAMEAWVGTLLEAMLGAGVGTEDPEEAVATATWCLAQGEAWCRALLASPGSAPPACPDAEVALALMELRDHYADLYGAEPPSLGPGREARSPRRVQPGEPLDRVGFYEELPHGDPDGPSLLAALRPQPQRYEKELLAWLEEAPVFRAAVGVVEDVLVPERGLVCAPHIHSDGCCCWPADLVHYVREYHARLPAWFVDHVLRQG